VGAVAAMQARAAVATSICYEYMVLLAPGILEVSVARGAARPNQFFVLCLWRWRRVRCLGHDRPLHQAEFETFVALHLRAGSGVRREKVALSSGCKPRPATAPAKSNRSSHGGNEVAEAFGC
jgi:hypothetical protein